MRNMKYLIVIATAALLLAACSREPAETPAEVVQAPAIAPASNLVMICIDTVRGSNFFNPAIQDELTPWLDSAQQYLDATSAARPPTARTPGGTNRTCIDRPRRPSTIATASLIVTVKELIR